MEKAIELIKRHEGLRLEAYRCPAGVWTIGWGHTVGVKEGDTVTPEQAERLLHADVARLYRNLDNLQYDACISLTDNQRAALVSFAYNVGFRALEDSTLWRRVKGNPTHPGIRDEFARWRFAAGREMPGLVKRRAQEADLYFS